MTAVLVRPVPYCFKVQREVSQHFKIIARGFHDVLGCKRTIHPEKGAEGIVLSMGPCFCGLLKSRSVKADVRAGHGIGTLHSSINDVFKPMPVSRKELHQSGHRMSRCEHIAVDKQRMTHMDIVSNPHMLISALLHRLSDDSSGKEVRAERSELERSMAFKKTPESSQTSQIITIRHMGQKLL